jgi:hypothetical protein
VARNANAAARRSEDPGMVKLTVQMPLPSSLDSSILTLTPSDWREHLIQRDADNAEALCHLPFSCNSNSKTKPAAARTRSPPKKTYGSQNESLTNAMVVGAFTPQAIQFILSKAIHCLVLLSCLSRMKCHALFVSRLRHCPVHLFTSFYVTHQELILL